MKIRKAPFFQIFASYYLSFICCCEIEKLQLENSLESRKAVITTQVFWALPSDSFHVTRKQDAAESSIVTFYCSELPSAELAEIH